MIIVFDQFEIMVIGILASRVSSIGASIRG